MLDPGVGRRRLASLLVSPRAERDPVEVVRHLLAVQAQDLEHALWAVGLRAGCTRAAVGAALDDGRLVRTWVMRGTLHLVAAEDVRWMLAELAPRIQPAMEYTAVPLGLTGEVMAAARDVVRSALSAGPTSRADLYAALDAAGVTIARRGSHLLARLGVEGLLCPGPRIGKQQSFVLLDDLVPARPGPPDVLAELGRRYLAGHAPATPTDLAWWCGLPPAQCRRAVASYDGSVPLPEGEGVHLLPAFDELLLGYADRSALVSREDAVRLCPGRNGVFRPMLVVDGVIAGTWKRTGSSATPEVTLEPWRRLTKAECAGADDEVDRLRAFLTQ